MFSQVNLFYLSIISFHILHQQQGLATTNSLERKEKIFKNEFVCKKRKEGAHNKLQKYREKKINNNPSSQFADNSIEIYNLVTTLETRITKEEKDKTNKRIAIIIIRE